MIHGQLFRNHRDDCLLENFSLATSLGERMRGLLGRPPLAHNQGLLISPCNSVHTLGMTYPIDVIYIDRNQCVVKIVPELKPQRVSFCIKASATLELCAGSAKKLKLNLGDQLFWQMSDKRAA